MVVSAPQVHLAEFFVDTRRGRLRYRTNAHDTSAKGINVVLIHGLVISIEYMMPFAELLAPYCRVWAVDLPGYGMSDKPEHLPPTHELGDSIRDWMDAAGLSTASVLGNSYGCQIVAEFAARHPENVKKIVLVGPTMDPHARSFWRQFPRWLLNAKREESGLGRHLVRDYLRAGPRLIRENIQHCLGHEIDKILSKISAPTLIVRGGRDPLVPQQWAEEATNLLPNGTLRVIPGMSHTVNFSAPLELLRICKPFLELTDNPRS